jgi:hypothetical protein
MLGISMTVEATTGLTATSLPVLVPILKGRWHELKDSHLDRVQLRKSSSMAETEPKSAIQADVSNK